MVIILVALTEVVRFISTANIFKLYAVFRTYVVPIFMKLLCLLRPFGWPTSQSIY
jgi:hypothetical protein